MKKGVWRSKISWLFLIHYELSENQIKFFWFFTVFWGDLEGAGWFSPPPLSSNIQKPRPIRVKHLSQWSECRILSYWSWLGLCLEDWTLTKNNKNKFQRVYDNWFIVWLKTDGNSVSMILAMIKCNSTWKCTLTEHVKKCCQPWTMFFSAK